MGDEKTVREGWYKTKIAVVNIVLSDTLGKGKRRNCKLIVSAKNIKWNPEYNNIICDYSFTFLSKGILGCGE